MTDKKDKENWQKNEQEKTLYTILGVGTFVTFLLILFQWFLYKETPVGTNNLSSSSISEEDFSGFAPLISTGSILLYRDFIMTVPITPENIRKYSYQIQVEGHIESATLSIEASTTDFGTDPTRIHSVYFYIDDGKNGGHLDTVRKDSRISEGGFTIKSSPYKKTFNLSKLPISNQVNGSRQIDVLSILSDKKPHNIGSFVATGIYGSLDLLEIDYKCQIGLDCRIKLVP